MKSVLRDSVLEKQERNKDLSVKDHFYKILRESFDFNFKVADMYD